MTRREQLVALVCAVVLAAGGTAVTRWPAPAVRATGHDAHSARPELPASAPSPAAAAPSPGTTADPGTDAVPVAVRRPHERTHSQQPPRLDRDSLDATSVVVPEELQVRAGGTFTLVVHGLSSHNLLPGFVWSDGTAQAVVGIACADGPPRPTPLPSPSASASPDPFGRLPLPSPTPSATSTSTPAQPAPSPSTSAPPMRPYAFTDHHAYRYPGVYYVVLRLQAVCDRSSGSIWRAVRVTVSGPAAASNGPQAPQPALSLGTAAHPDDPSWFFGYANDNDGWVRELRVDWGDGAPDAVYRYPIKACHDPAWTWPHGMGQGFDVQHRWAHAGSHTVRLQVTSTGCDGRSPQRASVTLRT